MKQTFIKGNLEVPHWNGQRQMPLVVAPKLISAQLHPYPTRPLHDENCLIQTTLVRKFTTSA